MPDEAHSCGGQEGWDYPVLWAIARQMMFHNLMPSQCPGSASSWIGGVQLSFYNTGFDKGLLADALVSRV